MFKKVEEEIFLKEQKYQVKKEVLYIFGIT